MRFARVCSDFGPKFYPRPLEVRVYPERIQRLLFEQISAPFLRIDGEGISRSLSNERPKGKGRLARAEGVLSIGAIT